MQEKKLCSYILKCIDKTDIRKYLRYLKGANLHIHGEGVKPHWADESDPACQGVHQVLEENDEINCVRNWNSTGGKKNNNKKINN